MTEDKQIEKMAKDIEACDRDRTELCRNVKCKEYRYFYSTEDCYTIRLSEMLVAKGYRKAEDVAREIFAEIEHYVIREITVGGENITLFNGKNYAELKKKYESEGTNRAS